MNFCNLFQMKMTLKWVSFWAYLAKLNHIINISRPIKNYLNGDDIKIWGNFGTHSVVFWANRGRRTSCVSVAIEFSRSWWIYLGTDATFIVQHLLILSWTAIILRDRYIKRIFLRKVVSFRCFYTYIASSNLMLVIRGFLTC